MGRDLAPLEKPGVSALARRLRRDRLTIRRSPRFAMAKRDRAKYQNTADIITENKLSVNAKPTLLSLILLNF